MIRRLVSKILITALALWIADYFLDGFSVLGDVKGYLLAGTVLGLLNMLVRPVVKLLTFPLILVTLGLFTIVINAAMLWTAAHITGIIIISGIGTLLWTTLVISAMNMLFDGSASK
jgi:putative membrane protein